MLRDFSVIPEQRHILNSENSMFYLIDKPLGISSFDVIRRLRKLLNIKKMGHAGTLDPLATGVILIATEKNTKLLHLLDNCDKEYIFTIRFDGKTDSMDLGTPIQSVDTGNYIEKSDAEICRFVLSQKTQIPPKYSALHIDWERAYILARAGETFELRERAIQVKDVEVLGRTHHSIELRMVLSSWWYVRSFAPLLWRFLWVEWGYITMLRRTKIVTPYSILSLSNSSPIENPIPIRYEDIFTWVPIKDVDIETIEFLKVWKNILSSSDIDSEKWSLVFFRNSTLWYHSLIKYDNGIYSIVRNDVA